ncbi:04f65b2a-d365-4447-9dff-3887e3ed18f5 [Sclerotinia trifoliorum]|uniref:04f65b2a-d365-4447-9dff-3887e3ed18f5 n=1 Tax=Sclerotinia trifoliorum TaxID=28548 RepID=A0A8H2ZK90_9HELO|nr:04f65b2a-d365-4447-9dff-3887e3ed18f5 [Sclerotinia trifoliorum]
MTEKIQNLVQWATSSGAYLHPDVEIYKDAVTGLSFKALKAIPPQTSIVRCSYQISLSYLNAVGIYSRFPSTESFPTEFLETLKQDDPNIIGHFFLMQQYLKGEKSPWWQYIRLLPQPDDPKGLGIPIWWPEEDQRFLAGTNAGPPLQKREQMWRDQWKKGVVLLRELPNHKEYSYILYQWAATIFDSRSFRPSLTICPEALSESSIEMDLNLDHVRNDRFSILYPLVDIGNHNGINQVEWKQDLNSNSFDLVHSAGVSEGDQIYNYYGNKSNSELLLGYGFILPDDLVNRNVVNLKLTPGPDAIQLRRSQNCHIPPDPKQPEEEFMFAVQPPSTNKSPDPRIIEFRSFEESLVDLVCCMVVNERERSYMLKHPEICPEKCAQPFQSPLCRALFHAIFIIQSKLSYEIERIEQTGATLGVPQNPNQTLATIYRASQLSTLQCALQPLNNLTMQILSPSPRVPSPSPTGKAKIIPIEQAYLLLTQHYPSLSTTIHDLIAEDQEEELPLDWSVLLEDWAYTYWTLWIYIMMLKISDKQNVAAIHPTLEHWIRDGTSIPSPLQPPHRNPSTTFHGAHDEHSTLTTTITQLQKKHPELFASPTVNYEHLLNLASYLVKEQGFMVPYEMLDGAAKGNKINQLVLCIWGVEL